MLVEVLPLALLDAVSVSTLAVPIWFLLTPHGLRYRNVAGYLLLVAAGYLLLGLALLAGMSSAEQQIRDALASPAGDVAATVAAVALLALAAWHGLVQPRLKARRGPEPDGPGRLDRWREAAVGETGTWRGVLTVAAIAVLVEVATMFPYLIAIDRLDDSGTPAPAGAGVLAVYCLVMVVPAAVGTLGRRWSGDLLLPVLTRIDRWIRRTEREDTAWLLALVGVLILSTTTAFDQALARLD